MDIHDHFDGSNFCVECVGPCNLAGEALLATKLIRFIFEQWALGYSTPNMMITSTIKESGINFARFKRRAIDAVPKEQQARAATARGLL